MKKSIIALSLLMSLSPLAAFAATAPLDLVGPVSDYKIYVTEEIGELVTQTKAFTDAINKGDLATAKKLYAPTRVHYESIEPIAELFSDLDASIDSRVDDHEKGVTAEDFTGFHRIEYVLFSQNSHQRPGDADRQAQHRRQRLENPCRWPDLPPRKSRRRCRRIARRSRRHQDIR